ncbi:uncharacterized protein [Aegilops tauschii subsp. strangulata]|uniref:uncharacterized protein n=1 Tax=Aegilops tauschii subsp. strangulata TaxID=200361 RepID=UPI001ABC1727|nr:uncharacterized protein LOC120966802 [Aegilops tauschii subsp. strangulata]
MAGETQDTDMLELESLQLDIKTLRQDREEDRKELYHFTESVNKNFASIQRNFKKIQSTLQKLATEQSGEEEDEDDERPDPLSGHGSTAIPPGRPKQLPNNQLATDKQDPATGGSAMLVDKTTGRELNLDGTPKGPYRHPNHAANKQEFHTPQQQQVQGVQHLRTVEEFPEAEVRRDRHRPYTPEIRRNILSVKPTKLNIAEFEGLDADSWIQNIEQYFSTSRTSIEQRTEIAVSYLKGEAIQWWRGTGFIVSNTPWQKFCSAITQRFAVTSVCENVKAFHKLTQHATVAQYISEFEQQMNLMRRDNSAVPDNYYLHSFISGLNPYIQSHLECLERTDMQKAMWLARRIEKSCPPSTSQKTYVPNFRRGTQGEIPKPPMATSTAPASVIQQAREKGICYKCGEPWFPCHKPVCKMSQKSQIQALQEQAGNPDIIYIVDAEEVQSDVEEEPPDSTELKISMHAATGIPEEKKKHTFTLQVKIGNIVGLALVDSGSTTTFISPALAAQSGCSATPVKQVQVNVANGGKLYSDFSLHNISYNIQGVELVSDFRFLQLTGYDIILGADWMYRHSPVTFDLPNMSLGIKQVTGESITFLDESLPTSPCTPILQDMEKILDNMLSRALMWMQPVQLDTLLETVQKPEITKVLENYKDVFEEPTGLPPKRDCDHAINLEPGAPVINQRGYRLPDHQKNALEEIIKDLLKKGIIRLSHSPYSSPTILVKKKGMDWRLCIDYRKLNSHTIKNKYPIPMIEDLLDELNGAKIFTKLDLRSGYHQIRMKEEDIGKTAFSTHIGLFEFLVMPFGVTNGPPSFTELMQTVLGPLLRDCVLVFFDDILIFSKSYKEHLEHVALVMEALRKHQLYAKLSKCIFAQS